MSSDDAATGLISQGYSIATYLQAIRIETTKNDTKIQALEAEIATLRAEADALSDENQELKVNVEEFMNQAQTYTAQAGSLEEQLQTVIQELAASRSMGEQLSRSLPALAALQAECENDDSGGDANSGFHEYDGDNGREEQNEVSIKEVSIKEVRDGEEVYYSSEWIPSQRSDRSPPRPPLQAFCTPPPRKRQKEAPQEQRLVISPAHRRHLLFGDAAVSLTLALEKLQPWNAVYAKSPSFSHSFNYESLEEETKEVIYSLLVFKSKFRRELWEQLHWIRFPTGGDLITGATAARESRHQTALTKWKEVQEKLIAQIVTNRLPKHVWGEPFFWIWRTKPVTIPLTCTAEHSVTALDKKEPMRCFYVDCIGSHPFYKKCDYSRNYLLPVVDEAAERFI